MVTLLNGFQPLGLQIKEGVLQLANQGGSTLACKSRPTYISSNVTFERSGFENCTNMLCKNALQIYAVQIYTQQYMLCKYMKCKYMLCKYMLCKYMLCKNMECKYVLCKKMCKNSACGVYFGATDRSNTRKVEPKFII